MTDEERSRSPGVNELLERARAGDPAAAQELMPIVYGELRALAASQMRSERKDITLQPTALVHEAWLRLVGSEMAFENRAHFFGAAARAMRRVLIDHARRIDRSPRRSARERASLGVLQLSEAGEERDLMDLLSVNEALERLEAIDPAKADIVTLRFVLGCTIEETAAALGCSPAKVKKDWAFARAWLARELSAGVDPEVEGGDGP